MANLHQEFGQFHNEIALSSEQKDSLRTSRSAVRVRIRRCFTNELGITAPKFRGQGSYSMGTITNPLDGEFDIDDGVYLQHLDNADDSDRPTPETVHRWLVKANEGYTKERPIDKRTCVRVRYTGNYHVDLPSYAELNGKYLLAEKGPKGWHASDPKALTDWFKGKVKEQGEQLRRVVRYLKAWADFQASKGGKMPNGLILTVLTVQNFRADERDDKSFMNTAQAVSNAVSFLFYILNPVDSSEELTSRLTEEQKKRFQEAIADLSSDGSKAIENSSASASSRLCRNQLGDRFPLIEKEDEESTQKADAGRLAAFYGARNPSKPWGFR